MDINIDSYPLHIIHIKQVIAKKGESLNDKHLIIISSEKLWLGLESTEIHAVLIRLQIDLEIGLFSKLKQYWASKNNVRYKVLFLLCYDNILYEWD